MNTIDRRALLGGMAGFAALATSGCAAPRGASGRVFPSAAGPLSLPPEPALDPKTRLTRIGIGSCFNQQRESAILGTAIRTRPDLFVMMGDNVYGATTSPNVDELVGAYAAALARPDYRAFRAAMPFAAVWDDGDYGGNDAGNDYPYRAATTPLFFDFWGIPEGTARRSRGGIYDAFITGPKDARVQTILLDTRSFRDRFKPTDEPGVVGKQRYIEDPDPAKTVLGEAQWAWLEEQLAQPADLRLVVTSYQLVADGHGWERWGLFPAERQRFYDLVVKTRANGVVLVSGDRHRAAVYRETRGAPYPMHELTSSAMNVGWSKSDEPDEEPGPNRIGPTFRQNNVGLVDLDWDSRKIGFFILDENDKTVLSHSFSMDALKA